MDLVWKALSESEIPVHRLVTYIAVTSGSQAFPNLAKQMTGTAGPGGRALFELWDESTSDVSSLFDGLRNSKHNRIAMADIAADRRSYCM